MHTRSRFACDGNSMVNLSDRGSCRKYERFCAPAYQISGAPACPCGQIPLSHNTIGHTKVRQRLCKSISSQATKTTELTSRRERVVAAQYGVLGSPPSLFPLNNHLSTAATLYRPPSHHDCFSLSVVDTAGSFCSDSLNSPAIGV